MKLSFLPKSKALVIGIFQRIYYTPVVHLLEKGDK